MGKSKETRKKVARFGTIRGVLAVSIASFIVLVLFGIRESRHRGNKVDALMVQVMSAYTEMALAQRGIDIVTLSRSSLISDYYRNRDFGLTAEAEVYRQELERYLKDFAERSRVYAQILYLDQRGREICAVGEVRSRSIQHDQEDYFIQAKRVSPESWWTSEKRNLPGLGPVIYYSKPVYDQEEAKMRFMGALVLVYDLSELRKLDIPLDSNLGKYAADYRAADNLSARVTIIGAAIAACGTIIGALIGILGLEARRSR